MRAHRPHLNTTAARRLAGAMARLRTALPLLCLCLGAPLWAFEATPLAAPAQPGSMAPRLAALGAGGAVLSWLERDGEHHQLRFAVFDGRRFGPARTITAGPGFFANRADTPGIGIAEQGFWVAHWLQRSGQGTYAYDVRMLLSHDAGESWSEPMSPHHDGTLTEHGFVSYYPAAGQRLGMAWLDGRETAPDPADAATEAGAAPGHAHHGGSRGAMTLRSAQIGADGNLGAEALLDDRVCDCCPTGAARTDEGAVVVYRNRSEDEIRDIQLVRETATGWSEPVRVHADNWKITGCPVNGPTVIARGRQVIVAWFTVDHGLPVVRLARSSDGGRSFAAAQDFDRGSAIGRAQLAWAGQGFALLWLSDAEAGAVLRLAQFNQAGRLQHSRDLPAPGGGRYGGFPRLLGLPDKRLLLAWTDSSDDDGSMVRITLITLD